VVLKTWKAGDHDTRTIRNLLGHRGVNTAMVYTHMRNRAGGRGIQSLADALFGRAAREQLLSAPKLLPPGGPSDPQLEPFEEDDENLEDP
jgi:hypothetical protein